MKQKVKETIFICSAFFIIGGLLGIIYGVLSGAYFYHEGLKTIITMFFAGGMLLLIFLILVYIITFGFGTIFKFLRAKLFK